MSTHRLSWRQDGKPLTRVGEPHELLAYANEAFVPHGIAYSIEPYIAPTADIDSVTTMVVKITPNDKANPPGKLADAELHFVGGPLDGLKLIGFGIWERRSTAGRNVTFPARQYAVNGERRSFALLRPTGPDSPNAGSDRVRKLVLDAYADFHQLTEKGA